MFALVDIIWYPRLKMQCTSFYFGQGPANSIEAEPLVAKPKPKQAAI